jgi:hypothetical protein
MTTVHSTIIKSLTTVHVGLRTWFVGDRFGRLETRQVAQEISVAWAKAWPCFHFDLLEETTLSRREEGEEKRELCEPAHSQAPLQCNRLFEYPGREFSHLVF